MVDELEHDTASEDTQAPQDAALEHEAHDELPAAFDLLAKTEELVTGHELGSEDADEPVTNRIFTVANVISIIRLCLIPAFVALLLDGHNYLATFVFALAAGTDFIDGYLARSTHTVSRLGKVLDPTVDRLLMITGVISVYLVGRLPLWIIIIVLARDIMMLFGGGYLLLRYKVRIPVVFAGKLATTCFFVGIIGLLLNWPLVDGLGVVSISWLPGFNDQVVPVGIWLVYAGLVIGLLTTIYYVAAALMKAGVVKDKQAQQKELERAQKEARKAEKSSRGLFGGLLGGNEADGQTESTDADTAIDSGDGVAQSEEGSGV